MRWWEAEAEAKRFACGVFEGGGAKGAFYGPALEAVRERGIWFVSVAGSSAGALTAAMVAAGAEPVQIRAWTLEALSTLQVRRPRALRILFRAFSGLRDDPPRVVSSTLLLFLVEAILRMQVGRVDLDMASIGQGFPSLSPLRWPDSLRRRIRYWIDETIRAGHERRGTGWPRSRPVTFAQLYEATGIELFIVSVDAVTKREHVFHHELTPNESVARAAVSSAAIPLYFPPGDVDAADEDPDAQTILFDGGVWSNFPTWVYKDPSFRAHHAMSGGVAPASQIGTKDDPYVLGFLLDEQTGPDGATVADAAPRPSFVRRAVRAPAVMAFCAFTSPIYLAGLAVFGLAIVTSTGCETLAVESLCTAKRSASNEWVAPAVGLLFVVIAIYQYFRARDYSGRFLPVHYTRFEFLGTVLGFAFVTAAERIVNTPSNPPATAVDDNLAISLTVALGLGAAVVTIAVLAIAMVGPAAYGVGARIAGTLTSAGSARYWVGAASDDLVIRIPVAGIGTLDFDRAAALLDERADAVRTTVSAALDDEFTALEDARQTAPPARPATLF